MAVIALTSAKGAPGVTTTAVALCLAWPLTVDRDALVFDADPLGGGTAAGVLRSVVGPRSGVLALAGDRTSTSAVAVDKASVALEATGRAQLLPGVPDFGRAGAIPIAWDQLRDSGLPSAGEVLVDAGRHDPRAVLPSWLGQADLVLVVSRLSLPAVRATELLVATWPGDPTKLRLLAIGSSGPYSAPAAAAALQVELLGEIAFEPSRAAVYSDGNRPQRGHGRSAYLRDVQQTARSCAALLTDLLPATANSGAPR